MKFEYEGIIKKKKDKRTWQVSLCVSFSLEDTEGGWWVSCGPLLALMQHGTSPAGSCLQDQPKTTVLRSLSSPNINSIWCWGQMPGSLGCWCLRYRSEINQMTSQSSNFKQLCTNSMKARHFTCSALVSPLQIPETYSAWRFKHWKSEVLLGSSGIRTHSEGSGFPLLDND